VKIALNGLNQGELKSFMDDPYFIKNADGEERAKLKSKTIGSDVKTPFFIGSNSSVLLRKAELFFANASSKDLKRYKLLKKCEAEPAFKD
jgi:hypothetical protein